MRLSDREQEVLKDTGFFDVKHAVTSKVVALFGELEVALKEGIDAYTQIPSEVNTSSGKIFRGENYRKYPYILLDYPRLFSTQTVFAFRSMLWWGHHFSFTLHLQGEAWEKFRDFVRLQPANDIFICVNNTPWEYHYGKDNYVTLEEFLDSGMPVPGLNFLKLSRRMPLEHHDQTISSAVKTFRDFLGMISSR